MSLAKICFAISMILFFLLGFHVVSPNSKVNLDQIGFALIALGLLLEGYVVTLPIMRSS